MELEDYFEFVSKETIRIAGTRVGIEKVLADYQQGASPEEIVLRYPTLSLEQVHATITYYLANQERLNTYLDQVIHHLQEAWHEQQRHPSDFVRGLRSRLEQQKRALGKEKNQQSPMVGG